MIAKYLLALGSIFLLCTFLQAQTTEFTYQGSLNDGSSPANGNYDFEFRLFDALSDGTQQGSTIQRLNVGVTNGSFSVLLDFGATAFPGANRFLNIAVRAAGGQSFTPLAPRHKITAQPYSTRGLNSATADTLSASCVGCIGASQIGSVSGASVVGSLPVSSIPAGSSNYIQNIVTQQPTSNFNVSGTGAANFLNARTNFQLNGERVLSMPGFQGNRNFFVGINTGIGVNSGDNNALFGFQAGRDLINGSDNSFFGLSAGQANAVGNSNSFFGKSAGAANFDGDGNSFFGVASGQSNINGDFNSFFGTGAGVGNINGIQSSFFGYYAGSDAIGNQNTFFGYRAGLGNGNGGQNTAIGWSAGFSLNDLSYSTVIGAGAVSTDSNNVQLGRFDIDSVRVGKFPGGGSIHVCATTNNLLTTCSSSGRYKKNVSQFDSGIEVIRNLRPVSFVWIDGERKDLGLIAEEVAQIEKLLVTYNVKGEVEGVKYDRLGVIAVNAIKEQQAQIERQQMQINELKKIVCSLKPDAEVCKEEK